MKKSMKPVKVAIAIGTILFVLSWHLIATRDKPRLEKIAAEMVATKEFVRAPSPNHAGTRLLYVDTVEHGTTAHFVDIASGQVKPLENATSVPFLGWTPDDTVFAYVLGAPDKKIAICDGNSGETLATLPETRPVSEGVWLSDDALVYVNNATTLVLLQKSGDDWHKASLFATNKPAVKVTAANPAIQPATNKPAGELNQLTNAVVAKKAAAKKAPVRSAPPKDPVQNLVAVSEKSVAWRQGGAIWMYELGSEAPVKIWEQTNNWTLVNFCYSGKQQAFRLHCKNDAGEFLFSLYPAFIWHDERITDPEPIMPVIGAAYHNSVIHPKRAWIRISDPERDIRRHGHPNGFKFSPRQIDLGGGGGHGQPGGE